MEERSFSNLISKAETTEVKTGKLIKEEVNKDQEVVTEEQAIGEDEVTTDKQGYEEKGRNFFVKNTNEVTYSVKSYFMLDSQEKMAKKLNSEMRKFAIIKTLITTGLSFVGIFITCFWYVVSNDNLDLINEKLNNYIVTGSFLTLGISNISSIITNISIEQKFMDDENKYYEIFSLRKRRIIEKTTHKTEVKYITMCAIILCTLGITYAAFVSSNQTKLSVWQEKIQYSLYAINLVILYRYNYFTEVLKKEKYQKFLENLEKDRLSIKNRYNARKREFQNGK